MQINRKSVTTDRTQKSMTTERTPRVFNIEKPIFIFVGNIGYNF